MFLKSTLTTFVFLLFGSLPFFTQAATVTTAELKQDCEAEGRAEGMSGSDLQAYIETCIEEFTNVDMSSNRPAVQK